MLADIYGEGRLVAEASCPPPPSPAAPISCGRCMA